MFIERVTTNQGIQSNAVVSVIEDSTYYFIISDEGLDVITKVTKNRTAWINRAGGYTCIAQDDSYVYLGTSDAGVYRILKLHLSGNSISNVVSFLDSVDPYGDPYADLIDSNNVVDISVDDGNFLIATDTGINFYDGNDVFDKTLSVIKCQIVGTKLYYAVTNDGIHYRGSVPSINEWDEDAIYSIDPYVDVSVSDNIQDFVVIENASSVNGSSNKIVAGSDEGIIIIDTDELVSFDYAVVTVLDDTDLADEINDITELVLYGTEVYAKGEGVDKITINLIDTTTNSITEKGVFIDCT